MFHSRWKDGRPAAAVGRKIIAVAFGAVLGAGMLSNAAAAAPLGKTFVQKSNAKIEVFIRLSQPSVAELNAQAVRATGELASDEAQKAQAAAVTAEQASMRAAIESYGAKELSALKVGANGVRVLVDESQIENLRALPGVRSVGRVTKFKMDNITSVPAIGAPVVWQKYKVKGKGIRIAIIDSGIDYLHKNFGGKGDPAEYAANNKNVIEDDTFPTAKVVGGYDFAGPTYNADIAGSTPTPDPDPLDGNGHGSHVAGTAAGFGVEGSIGPGVAPEALLYAFKVFNDTEGSTNLVSDAIERALDPNQDGNMKDHVDVINMSLGSPFGDPDDPSAISAENAANLGVIVVTSAGNESKVPYVVGSPSVAPSVISTAAVTAAGRQATRVTVTAPANLARSYNNLEGNGGVKLTTPISNTLVRALNPVVGTNDDACAPLTNAAEVAGHIVLIRRGVCTFIDKAHTVQAAGAIAMIVWTDGASADREEPIVMALDNTVTIPAVMIGFDDGRTLAAAATTTAASPVKVTLDLGLNDDTIAGFSSRGPGHGGSTFKPDLSAPGVAIVSTGVGTGTGSLELQGTSMASPHVAGAAALLRQLHPKLPVEGIKALLQNSTVDANPQGDTSLTRQGVGSVRVSNAADLSSYATPGGVSFGRLNPTVPDFAQETVTLVNLERNARVFRVKHRPHRTYPGVSVQCPSFVVVPRGGAQDFKIRLTFNPFASTRAGVIDNGFVSQTEVDGWCVLDDGKDELRVGYIAVVDSASNVRVDKIKSGKTHRVVNIGPAFGIAEGFTWAAQGGANHRDDDVKPGHTFDQTGFRTAAPGIYDPFQVMEVGIALKQKFEHASDVSIELDLDFNNDGAPDAFLVAQDRSLLEGLNPGQFVTYQFNAAGQGFFDWNAIWDFNDRVMILPFTMNTGPGTGFVPTTKFTYTMFVTSGDGTQDTQTGTIDFSKELVQDLNSFGLDPLDAAEVHVTGAQQGKLLWLFPNDPVKGQETVDTIKPTAN
jgi:subtilisin family serine protease